MMRCLALLGTSTQTKDPELMHRTTLCFRYRFLIAAEEIRSTITNNYERNAFEKKIESLEFEKIGRNIEVRWKDELGTTQVENVSIDGLRLYVTSRNVWKNHPHTLNKEDVCFDQIMAENSKYFFNAVMTTLGKEYARVLSS